MISHRYRVQLQESRNLTKFKNPLTLEMLLTQQHPEMFLTQQHPEMKLVKRRRAPQIDTKYSMLSRDLSIKHLADLQLNS